MFLGKVQAAVWKKSERKGSKCFWDAKQWRKGFGARC